MTDTTVLIDRFVLEEFLGAGGMGEVYAAYDRRDARRVAVKRLRPGASRDPELVRRFAREGAILRSAAHPNIVSVLAVVDAPTGPHIVMEYVPGGTLQQRLEREPRLPLAQVLPMALDLSDALARAHRLGVIHRDLKPANVLLAEDGTPRLTDFGIATMAGTDPLTSPGQVVGTLPYLAPEGWDGDEVDARTDIWALGVMLYEMLAGRRPFLAEHAGMLLASITLSDPPDLATLRPDLPGALVEAIAAMLVKQPDRRMRSVRELGLVVEQLLHGPAAGSSTNGSAQTRISAASSSVPRSSTPLIGRAQQIAEIQARLTDDAVQLLTLTGPGGSGKTRLAIAAAERAHEHFAGGVVFVDLTPLTDTSLVLPALARALNVEEDPYRSLVDVIAEQMGSSRRLIVLDNFEQVLAAAPDIARLLSLAPGVKALVTSRFRLQVSAEQHCFVPPLGLPDSTDDMVGAVVASEAGALFVARARALDPHFSVTPSTARAVAEICRRLDGLPLAIELAAARARVLPPDALLTHLDRPLSLLTQGGMDRAPHQRTLRRTIEWSFRLLTASDQDLFVRLSAFMGGWSLEDAQACALGDTEWDLPTLVDGLQSLLEKSFLTMTTIHGEPRYDMLETLREFAREKFEIAPDRDQIRARHAQHFAGLAVEWSQEVTSARQAEAITKLAISHDNIRAALRWFESNEAGRLPHLTAALGRFWYLAGHWKEALSWYVRALTRSPESPATDRAGVLDLQGRLEMFLGNEQSALEHHEHAWSLAQATSDQRLRARASEGLGEVLLKMGKVSRATAVLEESAQIAREAAHPGTLAETLTTLATARVGHGAYHEAEALLVEALELGRTQGDRFALTRIHYYLAGLAMLRDDPGGCRQYCEAGQTVAADSGDEAWACHLDEMLGRALLVDARWAEATALLKHSLHSFHAVGSRSCLPHSFEAAARLCLARWGSHGAPETGHTAARFLGAADALCHKLDIAMLPVERALLAQTTDRARATLGEMTFQQDWEAGRHLSEADAILEVTALLG